MSETDAEDDDSTFPLVDRRTPVIDRIKGDDSSGPIREKIGGMREGSEENASELAEAVVESMSYEDQDPKEDFAIEFTDSFAKALSEQLDVDGDELDQEYLREVMAVIFVDEETVLQQAEDEPDEAEEEDDSLFGEEQEVETEDGSEDGNTET